MEFSSKGYYHQIYPSIAYGRDKDNGPMVDVGILVVTGRNIASLQSLLIHAGNSVRSRLYVRVQGAVIDQVLASIYFKSSIYCPQLDVRVLLGNNFPKHASLIGEEPLGEVSIPVPKFKKVVLGGTFDRLHNGHKVLLSKAAMLASESITCGVTNKGMIVNKSLYELIEPVEVRMAAVRDFVSDVSDSVVCLPEPIEDPFGPSIRQTDLEAIVVSKETVKGGQAVNRRREERKMSILEVEVIDLLQANDEILNETKISSSSRRREALGTLLKPPNVLPKSSPYLIGLTGGIAAGKSHIAKYIAENPIYEVIDCDKIAHTLYDNDNIQRELRSKFPEAVRNGEFDRRILREIVFTDKDRLSSLSSIFWPAIKDIVRKRIEASQKRVIFVEAAAIIEANWHHDLHELWTVFVPPEEQVKRVMERDHTTQSSAEQSVRSQICNKDRLAQSHVAFYSLWAKEQTRKQVDLALSLLSKRI